MCTIDKLANETNAESEKDTLRRFKYKMDKVAIEETQKDINADNIAK